MACNLVEILEDASQELLISFEVFPMKKYILAFLSLSMSWEVSEFHTVLC